MQWLLSLFRNGMKGGSPNAMLPRFRNKGAWFSLLALAAGATVYGVARKRTNGKMLRQLLQPFGKRFMKQA
jgi:hypothetical protein